MLDDAALDLLFRKARTFRGSSRAWQPKPVDESTLRQLSFDPLARATRLEERFERVVVLADILEASGGRQRRDVLHEAP